MKYLLVIVATIAVLGWSSNVTAQEPPPDFGETNLLVLACQYLTEVGQDQGLQVKNCRRVAPDEVNGYRALIHVRVLTDQGPFVLHVRLQKSLWAVSTFSQ